MSPAFDDYGNVNSRFWTKYAPEYFAEHGDLLGETRLLWCPEGLTEDDANLLGDVSGCDVLEVGCGAAQGARWVAANGGRVTGIDVSPGMLERARQACDEGGFEIDLHLADARDLPFADGSFDIVFTAFGAIPFIPDPDRMFLEVARVLRPGGRFVFSTSHPMRWVFPDDPSTDNLTVVRPYFQSEPYTENVDGKLDYAEFQHTFEDLTNGLIAAGFVIDRIIEPQWVPGNTHTWGSWSKERAPLVPGTVIMSAHLAD